jgi:hypothetical protein
VKKTNTDWNPKPSGQLERVGLFSAMLPVWSTQGLEIRMDKRIAGLLGAVGALASLPGAVAASPADPAVMLKAQSYAELLNPIPNAKAVLAAVDETQDRTANSFQVAEHHHHHHHRRHRHHHHHASINVMMS